MSQQKRIKSVPKPKEEQRSSSQDLPLKIRQTFYLFLGQALVVGGISLRLIVFIFQLEPGSLFAGFSVSLGFKFGASVLILIFAILTAVYLYFWWKNNYYLVDQERVTHQSGVFWIRRNTLRFPSLDELRLTQSLLGKIFNFGTILLHSSETEEKIKLNKIPQPHHYLKRFKQILPGAEVF